MTNGLTSGGQRHYRAYLLRLWDVDSDGQRVWRASLQDSHTGERRGFANLAALTAFLAEETGGPLNSHGVETPRRVVSDPTHSASP